MSGKFQTSFVFFVALCVASGAAAEPSEGTQPEQASAATATTSAEQSGLAATICTECHEISKVDPMKAVLMLTGLRMPPIGEVELTNDQRSGLIAEFCAKEYSTHEQRLACVRQFGLEYADELAEPMPVIISILPELDWEAIAYDRSSARVTFYDPTIEVIRTIIADTHCGSDQQCLDNVMALKLRLHGEMP